MVVAGIGGELIFETADFIEENRKSAESDSNVRIARKEAADGLKDAAKRLDEAKKEEDAARLALQSQIVVQGPRAPLIERNRSDLIRRLKVFSGQRCFIVTAAGSEANKNEIHNTLGIIEFILRSPEGAGWTLEFVNDETSNVPGIVVYVNSIAETRTSESARALSAALAGEFPKECWCREATPSESNVTHGHG
jgi:hypothetical protein